MSKRINIHSLLQASDSLPEESFRGFLRHYGIEIKAAEIEDLRALVEILSAIHSGVGAFDKFYVGYKIPQIGKEFDLLRFGVDSIINIEIKKTCTEKKIKTQLVRNGYYLSFIGRPVFSFTFVSDTGNLYFLRDGAHLEVVEADYLIDLLVNQKVNDDEIPDKLFNPSDFLVSPFNSTQKFLDGLYFLTHQQEEINKEITGSLLAGKSAKFISVMGSAGTGKTLLVYDLVRQVMEDGGNPFIIHCGQLNDGHYELRENGWKIVPIKGYANYDLADYDLIVIDEAQRIDPDQLKDIVEKVKSAKRCCIFSHDKLQTLAAWEEKRGISEKINSIPAISKYELSEKIRANKEIAVFIKMLFNAKKTFPMPNGGNIEINYFNTIKDARNYLDGLEGVWEVLRFTPSQYNNEHHEKYGDVFSKTSHQVIGQEFDGVVVTIDEYFSYNDDGELTYGGKAYYHPVKMLFQNITRSRRRLNLVIIKNERILNRCISILQVK